MYKNVLKEDFHEDRKIRGLDICIGNNPEVKRNDRSAIDWTNIEDVINFENTCNDHSKNVYIYEPKEGLKINIWKICQPLRPRIDSFVTLVPKEEVKELTSDEMKELRWIYYRRLYEDDLLQRIKLCKKRMKIKQKITARIENDKLQIIARELKQEEKNDWVLLRNRMVNKIQSDIQTERLNELKEWQEPYMAVVNREERLLGKHVEYLNNIILRFGYLSMAVEFMKRKFEIDFGKPFIAVNNIPGKEKRLPYKHMRPCQVALITEQRRRKFLMLGHIGKLELLPKIEEARDLERFARIPINQSLTGLEEIKLKYKLDNLRIVKPNRSRGLECFKVSYELKFDRQILLELINQSRNTACCTYKDAAVDENRNCYTKRSSFDLWMKTKALKPHVVRVTGDETYVHQTMNTRSQPKGITTVQQSVCGFQKEQLSLISALISKPRNKTIFERVPLKSASLESVLDERGKKKRSTLCMKLGTNAHLDDVLCYLHTTDKYQYRGELKTEHKLAKRGRVALCAENRTVYSGVGLNLNESRSEEIKLKQVEHEQTKERCKLTEKESDGEGAGKPTVIHQNLQKNVSFEITFDKPTRTAKPNISSARRSGKNRILISTENRNTENISYNRLKSEPDGINMFQDSSYKQKIQPKIELSECQPNVNEQYKSGLEYKVQTDETEMHNPMKEVNKKLTSLKRSQLNVKHSKAVSTPIDFKESKIGTKYRHNSIFYEPSRFRFSVLHGSVNIPCKIPIWIRKEVSPKLYDKSHNSNIGAHFGRSKNDNKTPKHQTILKSHKPVTMKGYALNTSSSPEYVKSLLKSKIPVRMMSKLYTTKAINSNTSTSDSNVQRCSDIFKRESGRSKIPVRIHGYVWSTNDRKEYDSRRNLKEVRRMLAPLSKIPISTERLKQYKAIKSLGLGRLPAMNQCRDVNSSSQPMKDDVYLPALSPFATGRCRSTSPSYSEISSEGNLNGEFDNYIGNVSAGSGQSFYRFSPVPPVRSKNATPEVNVRPPSAVTRQPFSRISLLSTIWDNTNGTFKMDRPISAGRSRSLSTYFPLPPIVSKRSE